MVHKNKVDPFLNKQFKESIHDIKMLVDSTMSQVHAENLIHNNYLSNDAFQDKVISRIKKPLSRKDFVHQLNNAVSVWTFAKTGIMRQYFRERLGAAKPSYSLKVAVKCNSLGGNDVLEEDLDYFVKTLTPFLNPSNIKFLKNKPNRVKVVNNLARMLDFPISVKETQTNTYLDENMIKGILLNEPDKYLPKGAISILEKGTPLEDLLVVTANIIEFNTKCGVHRIEGRIKTSESLKWAKYLTNIRREPLYDGLGAIEVCNSIEQIPCITKEVLDLKHNNPDNLEYRFAGKFLKKDPSKKELRLFAQNSENTLMDLLKHSYFIQNDTLSEYRVTNYVPKIIYGVWIDMNLKSNKAPIEVQVRDSFGQVLYGFNSPFGHNSNAYNTKRCSELHKPVKIQGKTYVVDKITKFLEEEVLLPAFKQANQFYV